MNTVPESQLHGRVALITGAGGGQGRAHALHLANAGADLILTDLGATDAQSHRLVQTTELARKLGARVVAGPADVRVPTAIGDLVDRGVQELGRLDIVVANAGVISTGSTLETSQDDWQRALDVNLTGAWNTCRAALPHLLHGGRGGSIIMVGSIYAIRASGTAVAYTASKHGLLGLAKALAVELAPHSIRVNSVHPTTVLTDMLRDISPQLSQDELAGRYLGFNALPVPWVEPADVSKLVAFLASDEARYITGAALPVDAGNLLLGSRASGS
ncbi:mycofactocin-coupled SDR family oxidoreductase [Kribbella sp. NPDC048915]|uniref:mycofactocin-coupled SDR family oxidoreductase n=1 Tax=Kribbella sp. NPDC048915 TaxID=3155148 RepID=UPI0033E9B336